MRITIIICVTLLVVSGERFLVSMEGIGIRKRKMALQEEGDPDPFGEAEENSSRHGCRYRLNGKNFNHEFTRMKQESVYDWKQAYADLERTIREDVQKLNELIDDEDSSCPARHLRIERRNALLYVLGLHEQLSHWDYGS